VATQKVIKVPIDLVIEKFGLLSNAASVVSVESHGEHLRFEVSSQPMIDKYQIVTTIFEVEYLPLKDLTEKLESLVGVNMKEFVVSFNQVDNFLVFTENAK
jgi:hypothetical protein